jgi:hypothetical protein
MLCMVGRTFPPVPLQSKVTIHQPSVPSCGRTVLLVRRFCEDKRHQGMNIGAGVVGEGEMPYISCISLDGSTAASAVCLSWRPRRDMPQVTSEGLSGPINTHHPTPSRTLSIRHIRV